VASTSGVTASRCSICNHPHANEISADLIAGVEYRAIVQKWDGAVSSSALSRHSQRHLALTLRDQAQARGTAAPVDLLQRLVEVADDARAARLRLRDSGTASAQARATDVEVKVLQSLLGQFGIDSKATVAAMEDAERLVRSVAKFSTAHPAASADLIREIRSQGLADFADQLEEIVNKKSSIERTPS
jgi:hypothetical protein